MLGAGPQDHNGYVIRRVMPHFDLHAGTGFPPLLRVQIRLCCGESGWTQAGHRRSSPEMFIRHFSRSVRMSAVQHGSSLRLGRQEVVLGSGRLFDNNEGPNVKLSFDGVRWITQTSHLRWDVFALKPVEDNITDSSKMHPNAQQTSMGQLSHDSGADFLARYDRSLLHRPCGKKRHPTIAALRPSFAIPSASEPSAPIGRDLDYNWEANFQWGSFGNDSIAAWSVSTETGYTFSQRPFSVLVPCYGRTCTAATGTGQGTPSARSIRSFPRGAYFTPKVIPFLGPQNLMDVHPMMQFQLRRNITGAISWDWYWRESVHDGVYAFGSGISWTLRTVPVRSIWEIRVTWRFAGRLRRISLPHSIWRDFGPAASSIMS